MTPQDDAFFVLPTEAEVRIDPTQTLTATTRAAARGDQAATDWLRTLAPDLWEDIDRDARIAAELDYYQETVSEQAMGGYQDESF